MPAAADGAGAAVAREDFLRISKPGKVLLLCILVLASSQPVWADEALLRSMLLPGSGQAHRGNYGRAAIFASTAVASGIGLFITQIHYNRASENYNDAKRNYIALTNQLDRGDLVSYEELTGTYQKMQANFDTADSRYAWRNVFLVTFIGSYALNIVDLLLSDRDTGENEPQLSVEFDGESVRLVKSVSF
jgi:hypothetical protein